jgi:hypothetical protein
VAPSGIAPLLPRDGIAPSPCRRRRHRSVSHHALRCHQLPAASRHNQPACAAGLHLTWSPSSRRHRRGPSGSDTNCWG